MKLVKALLDRNLEQFKEEFETLVHQKALEQCSELYPESLDEVAALSKTYHASTKELTQRRFKRVANPKSQRQDVKKMMHQEDPRINRGRSVREGQFDPKVAEILEEGIVKHKFVPATSTDRKMFPFSRFTSTEKTMFPKAPYHKAEIHHSEHGMVLHYPAGKEHKIEVHAGDHVYGKVVNSANHPERHAQLAAHFMNQTGGDASALHRTMKNYGFKYKHLAALGSDPMKEGVYFPSDPHVSIYHGLKTSEGGDSCQGAINCLRDKGIPARKTRSHLVGHVAIEVPKEHEDAATGCLNDLHKTS